MVFSIRPAGLLNFAATAAVLLASHSSVLAQSARLEDLLEERAGALNAPTFRATLPVVVGWFNGEPCLYISTEASDAGVAASYGANYAPALGSAANGGSVAPIYAVTNFAQGNIVPSAPVPAGPGSASPNYSPLWQVFMVTWNSGVTPQLLRSEQDVMAMQTAGKLTVSKTNIVVNCPIVWTQQGGALPGATVVLAAGPKAGTTAATATLPVTVGWFNGQRVLYVSPDASTAAAAGPHGNLSTLLTAAANTNAVAPIYSVTNARQGNIIPVAPVPTGPTSGSAGYTPLWQLVTVTWNAGITPFELKSSDDVQTAMRTGKVTLNMTNIVINCPVLYTPIGGLLPSVTVNAEPAQN